MCDDNAPGVCMLGQQIAGSCFGYYFGSVSMQAIGIGVWWSAVPGIVVGSSIGILAARNPDGVESISTLISVVTASSAGTVFASLAFPDFFVFISVFGTTCAVGLLYFQASHRAIFRPSKVKDEEADIQDVPGETSERYMRAPTEIRLSR